jgi:hypothetical protein
MIIEGVKITGLALEPLYLKINSPRVRLFLPLIFILVLSGCLTEPDCLVTATNIVKVSFKSPTGDTTRTIRVIQVGVSGTDKVILGDSVSNMLLPVNPGDTRTTFTFLFKHKVGGKYVASTGSVTLSYQRLNVVVGAQTCGSFAYYKDLAIAAYTFAAEPLILNPLLSTSNAVATNLEIRL